MQVASLYRIEPPGKGRSPEVVAREILALCHGDFSLTLSDLCRLFCCERQWASEMFLPNVRHICLTTFFHRYILELPNLSEDDKSLMAGGLYFFSKQDLTRFWRETASAGRKTEVIGLEQYLRPGASLSALVSGAGKRTARIRTEALSAVLTQEGMARYLRPRPQEFVPCALPEWDSGLVTTTRVMRQQGLRNNTAAYSWLLNHGAIHIQLRGKVLWYVPAASWKVPMAVAVET